MTAAAESFFQLTERYPDEESAERYFEARRWPNGATCPTCASPDVFKGAAGKRRRQVWHCRFCRAQFTVTSGTVMESTKLPLRKWLFAFHLIGASKKGISSLQLARMLDVTYRTAWHLSHIGGKPRYPGRLRRKAAVQAIVQRNDGKRKGRARTIKLDVENPDGRTVGAKLRKYTDEKRTVLMTDDSAIYGAVGHRFPDHHAVNHSAKEYAYAHPDGHLATTNTAEGLFANLKRQITGTHHHTSHKHLPRYLTEYDFKYNTRGETDVARTEYAIDSAEGQQLTLFKSAFGGPSLFDRKAGEPAPKSAREGWEPARGPRCVL